MCWKEHTLVAAARPELLFRTLDAERRRMEERWEKKRAFPIKDKMPPREFLKDTPPVIKEKEKFEVKEKEKTTVKDSPVSLRRRGVKDLPKDAAEVKDGAPKDGPREMKETPLKLRTMEEITGEGDMRSEAGFLAVVFRPVLSAKRALLTADLGETITAFARADFAREDDVKDAEVLARMGLYLLREAFPLAIRHEMGLDPKSKSVADLLKQYKDAIRSVEVKADGKVLTAAAKVKLDISPLLKAVADELPARTEANNLKQIALAFHNYEATYGHLPSAAICDGRGKPLLSWRVVILPYIEQDRLYREFKLDEPWDSPHNKKLIAKMPKLYHPVVTTGADPTSTVTHYQVFTGPKTIFATPDTKARLSRIPDGTSNTFLVAEAGKAVTWTKPDDIDVAGKELPRLGGQFAGFLHVAFADGSVKRIKRGVDERILRLFIDPADGMALDHDKLKP